MTNVEIFVVKFRQAVATMRQDGVSFKGYNAIDEFRSNMGVKAPHFAAM